MAASTTDRITSLGSGMSRALAFGVVLAIVVAMAAVLTVVGVDDVEVVATLMVAGVFGAGLFLGQRPGLAAAGVATAVYVAMRWSDIEAAGAASLVLLAAARAVAYGVVSFAGSRVRQLIDDLAPAGAQVDARGLREGRAAASSPMFMFDDEGRPAPVPAGVGARGAEATPWEDTAAPWDGPPPSTWQQGPAEAPGWDGGDAWAAGPQFYASSGSHPQVPAEAAYGPDPRSGGYPAVPDAPYGADPVSGGYPAVPDAPYGADPVSGGYPAMPGDVYGPDPASGGYPPVPGTAYGPDPASGGYPAVGDAAAFGPDPLSGGYPAVDPHSGQYAAMPGPAGYGPDPRSGQYPAVDPGWGPQADTAYPGDAAGMPGPWAPDDGRGHVPEAGPAGLGLTPSGRWDRVSDATPSGRWDRVPDGPPPGHWSGSPPVGDVPWDQIPVQGAAVAGPAAAALPPVDPETRLWSARYLCDRLAAEQQAAGQRGEPFSLVLVQVPDGPLAALSYRRQVTLLRELGHQFVAGGAVDHLVHVPDQTQHWFAVVLPGADRYEAQRFERHLRDGVGGYLRSRGLLLSELESASLTSPDDDEAMGAIWEGLIARGDAAGAPQMAFEY